MRKLLFFLLWVYGSASAQIVNFQPGQVLTAAQLNQSFAAVVPKAAFPVCLGSSFALTYDGTNFQCNSTINAVTLGGATFQAPGPIGGVSPSSATFTNLTANGTITLANGSLSDSYLASQAANTVLANVTGSPASPTAVSIATCNSASSALQYTGGTGWGCNSALATSGANSNITSLSGLTTPLSVAQGGTGGSSLAQYQPVAGSGTGALTTLGTGITGQVLTSNGNAAYPSFQAIPWASPPAIGNTTANSGAFTTLSASSTVSGTGFSTYLASPPAIGGTTPAAGAFATLSANGAVSGSGFQARFSSPGPIGNTAASTGAFTTLTASSTITPSTTAGIVGTTAADNAQAGSVGEFLSNSATGTSMTSGTAQNTTSVSLTAGDWDVQGNVQFLPSSVTSASTFTAGVSTTSATVGSVGSATILQFTMSSPLATWLATPTVRINVSTTTTVYLVANAAWSGGTMTNNAFIRARRVR